MIALATVVIVVLVSLLIARFATIALTLTGLSRESARFQARSALSGTGFTTSEAETVVNHPVRRRVVMALMLVGSAGLVTVIATLMLSFADAGGRQTLTRLAVLLAALFGVWLLARSRQVDRLLSRAMAGLISRWTGLDARDYGALLHLSDRYTVGELSVRDDDWVADRTLTELKLRDEGVVVLGITLADGSWIGSPTFETRIRAGDTVVAYGRSGRLIELDARSKGADGDAAHEHAAREHREHIAKFADGRDRIAG